MPYPRLSYGFSLILKLNTHFYSPISNSCILCEQQVKRAVFEIILEQRAEVQKVGRNVATSQRRVNEKRKSISGQRRNASTSRRQCNFCLAIIESKREQKTRGMEKRTNEGMESRAAATQISEKETYFCIFFFSDKTADIL